MGDGKPLFESKLFNFHGNFWINWTYFEFFFIYQKRTPLCSFEPLINPFKPSVHIKGILTDSVDPDQTPQNAASDQALHRLH